MMLKIEIIKDNKNTINALSLILPTLQMQIALLSSILFLSFPSTVLVTTLGNSWCHIFPWLINDVTLKVEFQLKLLKWLWFTLLVESWLAEPFLELSQVPWGTPEGIPWFPESGKDFSRKVRDQDALLEVNSCVDLSHIFG